jgi:hypothetical protein
MPTCVIPIAFFAECLWQSSFQHLFVVPERGNYVQFFEMSAQSVSEAPWQVDMERLGFCDPDAAAEKKLYKQNLYTHAWAKLCCVWPSQTLLVVAACEPPREEIIATRGEDSPQVTRSSLGFRPAALTQLNEGISMRPKGAMSMQSKFGKK